MPNAEANWTEFTSAASISQLTDVNLTNLTDESVLVYESDVSQWIATTQIVTYQPSITLQNDWIETTIQGSMLQTGTYFIQLFANDTQTGVNGTNNNGDTLVDFYPAPDTVYQIRVNIIQPQPDLVANSDQMLVPREAVILAALARAQAERGEDGGVQSAETYALFKQSLSDAIALESGRYIEDSEWVAI
jgi:large exoprotein involved in heme utilization and adhesion